MPSKIQFLKRKGCHLCDEALPVLEKACQNRVLVFETIDIDLIPGFEKYSDEIPVLLVNGKKVLKHYFPQRQLRRILDRLT
ncbi:MAG TPA: glutaredoxin family protein [Acidobacteriota bacterium]|jgi:thiol-disulfide isomerase/thioredoxin|nr:glutaredoxin family protein [Acidobacteriota bacterium]